MATRRPRKPRQGRDAAPTDSRIRWRVALADGTDAVIRAERWTEGTDWVQFFVGDREVAAYPRREVGSVEEGAGLLEEAGE